MATMGLEREVVDSQVLDRSVARFRAARITLPTFAELADPSRIDPAITAKLAGIDPDARDPLNLFRVHWYGDAARTGRVEVPGHVVLPKALTGVDAPIAVVFGDRFPMISAHKVLAAYACLVPRLVTGQFDGEAHRAIWPSTGNYCRGGVAISRILGCHGVAVLPAGMSQERFDWLDRWVLDPTDIVRTPGTESNVKEIYDECARLERDPANVIFNQFSEMVNHLVHFLATGQALGRVYEHLAAARPGLELAAFTSATGSAGTIAAGDHLKEAYGARIVAVEAAECPTMLDNGFGEHNIQGIGDKHIPLIHNVMNSDLVVGVSDRATDALGVLFADALGRRYLSARRGVPEATLAALDHLGLSGICNVLAAIKTAKHYGFGPDQLIVTVATDGAAMYGSERAKTRRERFPRGFDEVAAAEVYGEHLAGAATDRVLELTHRERTRIFNLGYYTWVEQQGVSLESFEERRHQKFWRGLRALLPTWDAMIADVNRRAA